MKSEAVSLHAAFIAALEYGGLFCPAKSKGGICLLYNLADTAFWRCRAVFRHAETNNIKCLLYDVISYCCLPLHGWLFIHGFISIGISDLVHFRFSKLFLTFHFHRHVHITLGKSDNILCPVFYFESMIKIDWFVFMVYYNSVDKFDQFYESLNYISSLL